MSEADEWARFAAFVRAQLVRAAHDYVNGDLGAHDQFHRTLGKIEKAFHDAIRAAMPGSADRSRRKLHAVFNEIGFDALDEAVRCKQEQRWREEDLRTKEKRDHG